MRLILMNIATCVKNINNLQCINDMVLLFGVR